MAAQVLLGATAAKMVKAGESPALHDAFDLLGAEEALQLA